MSPDQPGAQHVFGPIPTVQAMLVCEKVITEAETNMKTLINVFDIVKVPRQEPGSTSPPTARFSLYARLFDASGRYAFRVDFVQADEEHVIGQLVTDPIEIADPLAAVDVALPTPPLPVPVLGRYEFRLYANDVYLSHVGIRVIEQEGEP